jgi:hypothetical protein
MMRIIGNSLIVFSILFATATVLWFGLGLADMPENPTEDDRTTFVAALLFAIVLIILEAALLMFGRYLRHPSRGRDIQQACKPRRIRPLPLVVYLAGSIGIGVVAGLGTTVLPQIKGLGFLIGQPNVLTQLIAGGLLGFKLDRGTMTHAIKVAANLLYFSALFYPVYGMVTTDRAVEVVRYKRMKTLLILLCSVHILMALVLAMLLVA